MPTTVPALVADTAGAPLTRTTIERRDLGQNDVQIDIAYAGICHSDIHQARAEWGAAIFPMVPGHEIAGIVTAVGDGVTKHALGDRVGIGCFVDSCRECANCQAGEEQFCLKGNVATYNGRQYSGEDTFGGYSTQIVADENYVLRIPEGISLESAAPLLCAGITTYSPLKHWGAGPGTKVAIVGMGGLGHMGVKISHALGAETTVLSHSLSKEEDGLKFGADDYFATSDPETFEKNRGRFDLIINTVSADLDIDDYLSLLTLNGSMVFVGLPENVQSFRVFSLVGGRRSLAGSNIGGIRETQEMLDFCAEHELGAEVEIIGADDVDAAYERVVASDVRYRFVIDTATIPRELTTDMHADDARPVIRVVAALITDAAGRMLLVRKRGTSMFMQPGGKPEPGETDAAALARELGEEVGLDVDPAGFEHLGRFTTDAANEAGHALVAEMFRVVMPARARAEAAAEIEEVAWVHPRDFDGRPIAPLARDHAAGFSSDAE